MARGKRQKNLASGGIQERRKTRTFADKVMTKRQIMICPTCGEEIEVVRYVRPDGGKMFRDTIIRVCGCNRKEIYGSE